MTEIADLEKLLVDLTAEMEQRGATASPGPKNSKEYERLLGSANFPTTLKEACKAVQVRIDELKKKKTEEEKETKEKKEKVKEEEQEKEKTAEEKKGEAVDSIVGIREKSSGNTKENKDLPPPKARSGPKRGPG